MIKIGNLQTIETIFQEISNYLAHKKINVRETNFKKPWGGYFVIDDKDLEKFLELFFPTVYENGNFKNGKLSPKILVVAPNKRLSWQYHKRRAELWKLVAGESGIIRSENDSENKMESMVLGEIIELQCGERHRLVGLSSFGVISEIWQHTDSENPSNEEDIIRVQDDFGR